LFSSSGRLYLGAAVEPSPEPATRECPFCRETIRAQAIKCRYCGSSLLAALAEPAPAKGEETKDDGAPGHVTYVLDKDLIRFAKVAAASLSLIVVVSAAMTGLDLKTAVSDANKSSKEASTNLAAIQELKKQADDSMSKMNSDQQALAQQVDEMKRDIAELREELPAVREFVASSKVQTAPETTAAASKPASGSSGQGTSSTFTPLDVARLYSFPANLNGEGQTIGIVELGGGYRQADLDAYFATLKLPVPVVGWVSVDGGKNAPSGPDSADGQVVGDIEICGAIAPKAHLTVYFSGNKEDGIRDAVHAATYDKTHSPGILLIGWGGPEKSWSAGELKALDDALADAANHQITVVVASGDNGATDGGPSRAVDFPASSPWVLAVGGTRLNVRDGKVISEVVWNATSKGSGATGGGVSDVFHQPDWQSKAHIPPLLGQAGRGIPDVAANADPETGYILRFDGQTTVIGGTSMTAPLWAGLIALLNQGLGRRLGYMNPVLYASVGPSGAFNDITQGNNSTPTVPGCTAGPGWDYCTGWGSPNGSKLLEAFRKAK